MPFELTVDLRQLEHFSSQFGDFNVRLRAALIKAIGRSTRIVEAKAKALVSDQVLHVRTGHLRRSITSRVQPLPDRVRGIVGASAPYARIHELGGIIHVPEIRPRRAKALHFFAHSGGTVGHFTGYIGDEVFAMRTRPHDVKMPERSYLRRALREMSPQIRLEIRAAVREAAVIPKTGAPR